VRISFNLNKLEKERKKILEEAKRKVEKSIEKNA
jgi:hypothetical protein